MEGRQARHTNECLRDEIASYIDGELGPEQELELELHMASCPECAAELRLQRQLLCALEASLENGPEIDLPKDFTKIVVATAESSVSGLRRPTERFNAAFVCSGLFLAAMFAAVAASGDTLGSVFAVLDKMAAVASIVGHAAFDLAIGAVIVIRSLSSHFISGRADASLAFSAIVVFNYYLFSRAAAYIYRR